MIYQIEMKNESNGMEYLKKTITYPFTQELVDNLKKVIPSNIVSGDIKVSLFIIRPGSLSLKNISLNEFTKNRKEVFSLTMDDASALKIYGDLYDFVQAIPPYFKMEQTLV